MFGFSETVPAPAAKPSAATPSPPSPPLPVATVPFAHVAAVTRTLSGRCSLAHSLPDELPAPGRGETPRLARILVRFYVVRV